MTDLTTWLARTRPVRWGGRRRLIRWLWRYRWPGAPLTLALILAVAQYWYPPDQHPWLDKSIVIGIVTASCLLVLALIIGTQRPWGPQSTGILHFILGDLALYGLIALPGVFGWRVPWLPNDLPWYFLRANLAVAAPVLILAYSDWWVAWARDWWGLSWVRRWWRHKDSQW